MFHAGESHSHTCVRDRPGCRKEHRARVGAVWRQSPGRSSGGHPGQGPGGLNGYSRWIARSSELQKTFRREELTALEANWLRRIPVAVRRVRIPK